MATESGTATSTDIAQIYTEVSQKLLVFLIIGWFMFVVRALSAGETTSTLTGPIVMYVDTVEL